MSTARARIAPRHLLSLEELSAEEILSILDTAETFKEIQRRTIRKVPTLRGKTIVNLFYEASTRTRISFELAEKRLSADTVNFSKSGSSVAKGETLRDTARNLEAMAIDLLVVRHSEPGAAHYLARELHCPVVNAGDGAHEHPTQGLLDLLTMRDHRGRIEGLRVAIIGDIKHSRVARSNIWGLRKLGAEVTLCGPPTLIPMEVEALGVRVTHDLGDAIADADVIMALRLQHERMQGGYIPSLREYTERFGLTPARLESARPNPLIMHPGPVNRGVEISPDVVDGPYSVVMDQVTNGVAVRMAVIYLLCGGEAETETPH
jgi:aspartate carbamoyltransferase catalytic subunit